MMNTQKGFTLIELVVVMVILGALAATALPKFMNVSGKAHESAVAATGGAFGTAVAMVKSQYIVNGTVGADTDGVTGFGSGNVNTDASGWPTANSAAECKALWDDLMQNPPTAATATGSEYQVTYSAAAPANCTYTYQADISKNITYRLANYGNVSVTK